MVMLVILIVGGSALLLNSLSNTAIRTERDKITANSLAQAKQALIGYATNNDPPGQLPCPENTLAIGGPNEGSASGSCTLPAIGRLPWRTLGIGPLRDANGDLLWYAISQGFRTPPINSDSAAQLTVDGSVGSAVAIIFSVGPPINGQSRPIPTSSSPPLVAGYLDLSNNDGDNTFITGGPDATFNDRLLLVTHKDLFDVVEKRVAKEVINSLNEYFLANLFYPRPADFTDANCLGSAIITGVSCPSGATNKGRPPAHPSTDWDPASLLNGANSSSWFQTNGWRELVFYAVAPACTNGTTNCSGAGYLTLNNPPGTVINNQKVIVIATGNATPAQLHSTGNKNTISNYLEDENLLPFDDTFTKKAASPFNDIAISIP